MSKEKPRAKGSGSYYQAKDGRWRAELTVGYTPEGKAIRWRGTFPTQNKAARALAKAITDRDKDELVLDDKRTVGEFLADWLETSAKRHIAATTYERYRELLMVQAKGIHDKKLSRLTARDLDTLYNERLEHYAPSTVLKLHKVLHAAFDTAVNRWYIMLRNPCDRVDAPKVEQSEQQSLTPEQARRFLEALKGDPLEAWYLVSLACGLRPAELRALRWSDCDLAQGTLTVRRNAVRVKGQGWVFKETKTKRIRAVALAPFALEALKRHKLATMPSADSLVFANSKGNPLEPQNLQKRHWKPILERAGLSIRPYDLRHTFASLLGLVGAPVKVVSEAMGHADPSMTLAVYQHTMPVQHRDAVNKLGDLLDAE